MTYYRQVLDQNLSRDIHLALGFELAEKCDGRYIIEVRENEHEFAVSACNDKVVREFMFASGGETVLRDIWPARSVHSTGLKIETTHFTNGWIRKKMSWGQSVAGEPDTRFLQGQELEDERAQHYWLSKDLKHLMRPYITGEKRELLMEPEAGRFRFGTNPNKITQAEFFEKLKAPIGQFRPS